MNARIQTIKESQPYSSVEYSPAWSSDFQAACKPLLELVISVAALVLLSPAYLNLMIGVKLSSSGPVFYRRCWVGMEGRNTCLDSRRLR